MSGQGNLGEHQTQGQQLFSWCGLHVYAKSKDKYHSYSSVHTE